MMLGINSKQAGIDQDVICKVKHLMQSLLSRYEGVFSPVRARFFDVNDPKGGANVIWFL